MTGASSGIDTLLQGDAHERPESSKRFADGGRYRIEIPSIEGPEAMRAVFETAETRGVPVHRISQGSGAMLQTEGELAEMARLGTAHGVEVCLFQGPRAAWDVGVQVATMSGRSLSGALRGGDQLRFAVADVERACEAGIRSILLADIGAIFVIASLRARGDLPSDLVIKASAVLPIANPATARVVEDLGADTINVSGDLTCGQLAAIRAAVDVPLDVYVESPDDLGGMVRHYEIADLIRVAAPVHLKFGLRNAAGIYPSGGHLRALVLAGASERVRRAELGLSLLARSNPDLHRSASPVGVRDELRQPVAFEGE